MVYADRTRYVHIYFPKGYDGKTTYPLWIHLHGVFWATMGNITTQVRQAHLLCCETHLARRRCTMVVIGTAQCPV